ncbi:SDR family NAD(P)-dependent oxidoreductase [Nocardia violaceofusca]|uniref:SDR family NAD(P)-dependent oxidoreductase n=1 Tax=Nocardia violaceofusca TaxID=941182 RepID=UPI000A742CC2|nr:SDR family NAD(P)-dependent oxidoreductase [Nocardia violaceofusca]
MTNRFDHSIALVNAAAGAGIGSAIARRLLAEGATVVITDRSAKRLDKLAAQLVEENPGDRLTSRVVDAAAEAEVEELFASVADRHGRLDVLINNVGLNQLSPFPETTLESWETVLHTSLTSHFLHARAAWPLLRRSAAPAIVNVSSLASESPAPFGEVAYASAKAGVLGLTKALAVEGAAFGIRANAVVPGLIWNERLTAGVAPEYVDAYRSKRLFERDGEPDEVADVIMFLASTQSRNVTGQAVKVGA